MLMQLKTCYSHPQSPKKTVHEMMVAIRESVTNSVSSDHGEHGEDEDHEETEQGQLNDDDKSGYVMGTITKMVQQRTERLWQKRMNLDELTQPGWEDSPNFFLE
jgi:hypothetical protein